MALSLRAASSANLAGTTATTVTPTLPTGATTGDLVYVVATLGVALTAAPSVSGNWSGVYAVDNNGAQTAIFAYLTLTASDTTGPTLTWTGAAKVAWAAIALAPGTAGTIAVNAGVFNNPTNPGATATTNTPNAYAAGAQTGVSVLLTSLRKSATTSTAVTTTPPTNWTEPTNGDTSTATGTTSATRQVAAEVSYRLAQTGTITPGAETFSLTSYPIVNHVFAVEQVVYPNLSTLVTDFSAVPSFFDGNFGGAFINGSGQGEVPTINSYAAFKTAEYYNLAGDSVFAQVVQASGVSGSRQNSLKCIIDANNSVEMMYGGGVFTGRVQVAGTNTDTTLATYNATTHAWWRIREAAGTVYWDTAPDGVTWTNLGSRAHGLNLSAIQLSVQAGYWNAAEPGLPAADAIYDNLNYVPPTPISWAGDFSQADVVAGNFQDANWNRDDGTGAAGTIPWPMPIAVAPDGIRSAQVYLPSGGRRDEILPNHRDFVVLDTYWFGSSFYLPTGFDTTANAGSGYQVIEQLRQADNTGSPVAAFEVRNGNLLLTGGYGILGASPATQYQYSQTLVTGITTGVRHYMTYRVGPFSTTAGATTIDVYVDGTHVLAAFTIPPPTIIGGSTYQKQGWYRDPANTYTGYLYISHSKVDATQAAVDSTPSGTAYSQTVTDAAGAVDAATPATTYPRTVADTAGAADTASQAATYAPAIADTGGAVDAISVVVSYAPTIADTASAVDAVTTSTASNYTQTIADTAGAVDAVGSSVAKTLGDTAGAADSASSTASYAPTVADLAGAVDAVQAAAADSAQLADAAGAVDGVTPAASYTRTLADAAGAVDAATSAATYSDVLADAAGAADAAQVASADAATVGDTAAVSDAVTSTLSATSPVADSAPVVDAVSAVLGYGALLADTAGAADAVASTASYIQSAADAAGAADAVQVAAADTAQVADAEPITDAVTTTATYAQSPTDAAAAVDAVSPAVAKPVADTAPVADAATAAATYLPGAADSAPAGDATSVALGYGQTPTDAAGATDAVAVTATYSLAVADTAGAADTAQVSGAGGAQVVDGAPVADAANAVADYSRGLADVAGVSDGVTVAVVTTLADTAGAADAASSTATYGQTVADAAGAADIAQVSGAGVTQIADGAPVSDDLASAADYIITLADAAGAADAATAGIDYVVTAGDSVTAADAAGGSADYAPGVADGADVGDDIVVVAAGALQASVTDTAGATDAVMVSVAAVQVLADAAAVVDAVDVEQSFGDSNVTLADAAGVDDAAAAFVAAGQPAAFFAFLGGLM